MKMVATLALLAGTLGISAPAALAASLSPPASPAASDQPVTPICGCAHDRNVTAGFYGGFVSSPDDGPDVSGFYDTPNRYDEDATPPPYAFFPDRNRVYRMWGWRRGAPDRGAGD